MPGPVLRLRRLLSEVFTPAAVELSPRAAALAAPSDGPQLHVRLRQADLEPHVDQLRDAAAAGARSTMLVDGWIPGPLRPDVIVGQSLRAALELRAARGWLDADRPKVMSTAPHEGFDGRVLLVITDPPRLDPDVWRQLRDVDHLECVVVPSMTSSRSALSTAAWGSRGQGVAVAVRTAAPAPGEHVSRVAGASIIHGPRKGCSCPGSPSTPAVVRGAAGTNPVPVERRVVPTHAPCVSARHDPAVHRGHEPTGDHDG